MTDSYAWCVTQLWPDVFLNQALLVGAAWAHGCIGVHFRFRLEPAWRRVQGGLLVVAIMLPTLALAGFVAMAREAAAWPGGDDRRDRRRAGLDHARAASTDLPFGASGWSWPGSRWWLQS